MSWLIQTNFLQRIYKLVNSNTDNFQITFRFRYFLVGGINDTITHQINDKKQCELYTNVDNALDYERQKEVVFQIRAEDTLQTMGEQTHEVFAQIKIKVGDVNDETPQLIMVI